MAEKRIRNTNSMFREIGNGVAIGYMHPKARDLMDEALKGFKEHCKEIRKSNKGHPNPRFRNYRGSVYAFAYWLFRWSGLVQIK